MSGTFGPQAWSLPQAEVEYPLSVDAYKWFARFFLEGKVFAKLEKYAGQLLSSPSVMVKSWARLQARTEVLLKALMNREVRSKKALENVWRENPKCKYLMCLLEVHKKIIYILCAFLLFGFVSLNYRSKLGIINLNNLSMFKEIAYMMAASYIVDLIMKKHIYF